MSNDTRTSKTKLDPRFIEIGRTSDDREPVEVYEDQAVVIFDNLMSGYFRDPQRTDAMLRRDGMTKTADRLVELFGAGWWTDAASEDTGL